MTNEQLKTLEHTLIPTVYKETTNGNSSINFIELAKSLRKFFGEPTIDKRYFNPNFKPYYLDTFIAEIKNYGAVPESQIGIFEHKTPCLTDIKQIVSECKKVIKHYLVTMWDSTTTKLVFHSSGWDSRIISGCICELRDELGSDWIGNIHFRCHQKDETESFIKIMKLQGWDKSQYSGFIEKDEDCYDLGRFDRPVFGFHDMVQQYNFCGDLDTKKMILIGGVMGGEGLDYPRRMTNQYKAINYCKNLSLNRLLNYISAGNEGEMISYWMSNFKYAIYPYLSYDYIDFYSKLSVETICKYDIRKEVVASFKETLGIDLLNVQYYGHNYNWTFSTKRKQEILESYYTSLFYKTFKNELPEIDPIKNFNKFDGKIWMMAAAYDAIFKD